MMIQLATGALSAFVFALCFNQLRRTHPKRDDVFTWALSLVFCIASVLTLWAAVEMRATMAELFATILASAWLLASRTERRTPPACVSYPRELRTVEYPFVHGGKK